MNSNDGFFVVRRRPGTVCVGTKCPLCAAGHSPDMVIVSVYDTRDKTTKAMTMSKVSYEKLIKDDGLDIDNLPTDLRLEIG